MPWAPAVWKLNGGGWGGKKSWGQGFGFKSFLGGWVGGWVGGWGRLSLFFVGGWGSGFRVWGGFPSQLWNL